MATRKLSQIAASGSNFTSSDFIVAVQAGTTDVRYTNAQMFGAIVAATITQTIAANTSSDGLVLVDTATATVNNQQYSPRIKFSGSGWKTDATAGAQPVDWTIENVPVQGTSSPTPALVINDQVNNGGYNTRAVLYDIASAAQTDFQLVNGTSCQFTLSVAGSVRAAFYATNGEIRFGSVDNIPINFITNNAQHFSIATTGTMTGSFTPGANTGSEGLILVNAGTASSGNQQYSPAITLRGQGWKTDATAASQTADWVIYNIPQQGTSVAGAALLFGTNLNTLGLSTRFSLVDDNVNTTSTFTSASGQCQIIMSVGGVSKTVFFSDNSQGIIGSLANIPFFLYTNNTKRAAIPAAGGFVVGDQINDVGTSATDGFLYIPCCNGPPTGTPTTQTGSVAMIYDRANNKLYIYNTAWKGGTAPGAWS